MSVKDDLVKTGVWTTQADAISNATIAPRLTTAQVSALTTQQIATLTTANISGLTTAQIGVLNEKLATLCAISDILKVQSV